MTKNTFAALLSKEIGGNISENERNEIQNALAENPHLRDIYDEIHAFVQHQEQENIDIDTKLDEIWDKIAASPETPVYEIKRTSRRIIPQWGKIAVSIAIILCAGWLAYIFIPDKNIYTETLAATDETVFSVLDDGSQVWLAPHSQIRYNKNFGRKHRKIRLDGKAFFDVAHNPSVPLSVTVREIDVLVKGTAFNIDAATPDVEVALIRGLVAVKDNRNKNGQEIMLHPNQKILVRNGNISATDRNYVIRNIVQPNDTIVPETKWLNNELVFQKQRFVDLVKLMENRYKVSIRIENQKLSEQRFTGNIKSETLKQMLDALRQSYPFTYEIDGKKVIIR